MSGMPLGSGSLTPGGAPGRGRRRHLTGSPLIGLEFVVLGGLAAFLTLWVIPAAFQIDWSCLNQAGVTRLGGDTYLHAVVVIGTFGWLFAAMGELLAQIGDSRRAAAVIPAVWFTVFVGVALIAAAAVGPQICPA